MENRYMEVQSDRLMQDTEVLRGDIEKARQEMEALTELVASLHAHWEGAAAGMFGQRFADGMTALGDSLKELASFAESLGFASEKYVECENAVADIIAAVRM